MVRDLGLEAALAIRLLVARVLIWMGGIFLSLVILRVGSRWSLGTVRLCLELLRGFVNRGGGVLRRLIVWLLLLVVTMW